MERTHKGDYPQQEILIIMIIICLLLCVMVLTKTKYNLEKHLLMEKKYKMRRLHWYIAEQPRPWSKMIYLQILSFQ